MLYNNNQCYTVLCHIFQRSPRNIVFIVNTTHLSGLQLSVKRLGCGSAPEISTRELMPCRGVQVPRGLVGCCTVAVCIGKGGAEP